MSQKADFLVIGAGLAGSEAALTLARNGARVELWEQKPLRFSAAHKLKGPAELVCSNSFKSIETGSAHGLLKKELEILGSPLLEAAYASRVPGGKALSVDREKLSATVRSMIESEDRIVFRPKIAEEIPPSDRSSLIATGPLSGEELMKSLSELLGEDSLYFYDATAPVVSLDSLDLKHFFWGSRREQNSDDYLNLPLNKEQYIEFRNDLMGAEKMPAHLPEEKLKFFEGCLPIEVLAERGQETLAFSCMKPIGFEFQEKKPYAVIQFRREKAAAELLSMVGFQTRMKWPEQIRVLQKLPGMQKAEFVRLGAMHRNSFINAPKHLDDSLRLKAAPHLFLAGQITGSEGYTEALATGHYAALQMLGKEKFDENSSIQSLVNYLIRSDAKHFQPMNFNFGLLPPIPAKPDTMKRKLKKRERYELKAERSLEVVRKWQSRNSQDSSKSIWTSKSSSSTSLRTASKP